MTSFCTDIWSFQEEDGAPIPTTPLGWYDVMILIVLLQVLFRVSAAQMIPTWLAEMVHILYNILARSPQNTQRLFAILKDIDLEI